MTFPSIEQSLGLELFSSLLGVGTSQMSGWEHNPATPHQHTDLPRRWPEQRTRTGWAHGDPLLKVSQPPAVGCKSLHYTFSSQYLSRCTLSYSCKLLTSKPPVAQCSIVCTCPVCSAISFCWLCTRQLPASRDAPSSVIT